MDIQLFCDKNGMISGLWCGNIYHRKLIPLGFVYRYVYYIHIHIYIYTNYVWVYTYSYTLLCMQSPASKMNSMFCVHQICIYIRYAGNPVTYKMPHAQMTEARKTNQAEINVCAYVCF